MKSSMQGRAGLGALALVVAVAAPAAAATQSVTLANGAELSVTLDPAGSSGTFLIPDGSTDVDVPMTGEASIGEGEPNVHWTYVIDVSGSTVASCGGGLDILECEKLAVGNLNAAIASDGSALDVGLTVFGTSGASADMSADAGDQPVITPDDAGFATVLNSVDQGTVGQFQARFVGGSTNYTEGLQAALTSVNASTAVSKNVVFLSDGFSGSGEAGFNGAVNDLALAGATIFSFAVGPPASVSCTGGFAGTLQAMADATGGTCTNVPDPAMLPDIVQNVTATQMTSVTVDGAAPDTLSLATPFDGPNTATFTDTAAGLTPGTHTVCAAATGLGPKSDATSEQTVQACEDIHVFGFALAPATATNELGSDNQHTVTATLTGPAGMLEGWPVAFTVTGQNAGETGVCAPVSCATDASGVVTFTYDVDVASSSLGTDTITAAVTVDDETGTRDVTKDWVDTTPPVATCVPGPNPDGIIPAAPGEGGDAQNPDGFWTISATDDVWSEADLDVFVQDDASGFVFGPYGSPTNIKWVQAPGAPSKEKAGPGAVHWQLTGNGDALVYATDGSGNTSAAVSCLVPPPPQ